jgi:hypothetical protein
MTNLTLLTDNVKDGAKIVAKLEKKGIKTVHTFPSEISLKSKRPTESRRKKLGFWKGDARVKLTTFHSFKRWEGRLLVLNITQAQTPKDWALIYTGLTRLKKHQTGSCLTVVCSEQKLAGFGKYGQRTYHKRKLKTPLLPNEWCSKSTKPNPCHCEA